MPPYYPLPRSIAKTTTTSTTTTTTNIKEKVTAEKVEMLRNVRRKSYSDIRVIAVAAPLLTQTQHTQEIHRKCVY